MVQIEYLELYNQASIIISLVVGYAIKHYADIYTQSKKKLSQIRQVSNIVDQKISEIDDALQDDKVDNEEFARIFSIKTNEIKLSKEAIQK